MSFLKGNDVCNPKLNCHITHTNARSHDIIRQHMYDSPIFQKRTELLGPRYCPSIEQKVDRFPEKDSHQIFIEPEGLNSLEVYPNGISTSLPFDVQVTFIQSIKGFENAIITRPGYAISYGYFDPRGLRPSLESKLVKNLFFAGQINGTTGYEEAAAQGLMAGINAMLKNKGLPALVLGRDESYIGVLIDDLTTNGTIEPYRMFTSRAEYRLQLRCDNAHYRLTKLGFDLGVVSKQRYGDMLMDLQALEAAKAYLMKTRVCSKIKALGVSPDKKLSDWVKQPEIGIDLLLQMHPLANDSKPAYEQAMVDLRYEGYIQKQKNSIKKLNASNALKMPKEFDYHLVKGLSSELVEKLGLVSPETLGQASRISGMTPAALSILAIYIKKMETI
jgi:tRNA uridine 5-carboxymethylaminomethyl modification enzyme